MDIKDLRLYLPDRLRAAKTNPSKLAVDSGLGVGAITDILSGRINKPRYDTLAAIAKVLNCAVDDLYQDPYGVAQRIALEEQRDAPPIDIRPGGTAEMAMRLVEGARDLPLVGQARAGLDGIFIGNGEPMAFVRRPPNLTGVVAAFAVIVRGDSMEPRYFEDEIVYINPALPVSRGKFVLIETIRNEAFIKRFVTRDARFLKAEQLNPPITLEYAALDVKNVYRITGSAEGI